MVTTLGRELVRNALPDDYKGWADSALDKKRTTDLTTKLALKDPDAYVDILKKLGDIGERTVSLYGRDSALSYRELDSDKSLKALRDTLRSAVDRIMDDDSLSEDQKESKIIDLGYKYTAKVNDAVFDSQNRKGTSLANQINSGSRGNKTQLMQLLFGNMLMKDAMNRDIPYLHIDSFSEGTSPMAYWAAASSGRKGMYDVQAATGNAGYLSKQVTNVTHDVTIDRDDCGTTTTGVPFKATDPQNEGRVLLQPFHKYPAGSVVTREMLAEADDDEDMVLRTPMTCKSPHGVCAKCNGLDEHGRFPGIGDYVSLNSARSFTEKITQSGISSKHGSGIGGKKEIDPEGEDQPTGFANIERMFKVPSTFQGAAVLSPVDGTVTSIRPAAQGGNYITVGNETLYCKPERTFKVKAGDKVYAGDVLTNGVPNPSEIVQYKGLGEGRRYYMDKLGDIFKRSGFGVDRSNLESFSRALLNKVEITDPDGYEDYLPGDITDYSDIAATWQPRETAKEMAAKDTVGKYLEVPTLQYTIGTRITPAVVSNLEKHGFPKITVNDAPPPFSAKFLRPAEALRNDRNWLPRMMGERLRDSLFDAARKGITDSLDSKGYVDRLILAP